MWHGGDYADFNLAFAGRFITVGSVFLLLATALLLQNVKPSYSSAWRAASALVVFLVLNTSTLLAWHQHNAPLLDSDIWRTERTLAIRAATTDSAVVACHAAGQIGYYSHRACIDLLGKCDRVVATGPIATSFRPGHCKWDYDYSIGMLKPQIIADDWGTLRGWLQNRSTLNGVDYQKCSAGFWVSRGCPLSPTDLAAQQK